MDDRFADLLERLGVVIDGEPRLAAAIVFGSVARGTATGDSDVDVAYMTEPGAAWSLHDELALEGALAAVAGRDVDLVSFEDAPLPLRWRVVRDGVVIVDRSGGVAKRRMAQTALEHLDLQPTLQSAGRTFLARLARQAPA